MKQNHPIRTELKWSETLSNITDEARLPNENVICAYCPKAMWFSSPSSLKSFCGKMHIVSWSTNNPADIIHCDGATAEAE